MDDNKLQNLFNKSRQHVENNWDGSKRVWKRIQERLETTPVSPLVHFLKRPAFIFSSSIAIVLLISGILYLKSTKTDPSDFIFTIDDYATMVEISDLDIEGLADDDTDDVLIAETFNGASDPDESQKDNLDEIYNFYENL